MLNNFLASLPFMTETRADMIVSAFLPMVKAGFMQLIFVFFKSIPAITNSFTAFAFAPGALNTTIPFFVHSSTGMLFTPAPALAMHLKLSSKSMS